MSCILLLRLAHEENSTKITPPPVGNEDWMDTRRSKIQLLKERTAERSKFIIAAVVVQC